MGLLIMANRGHYTNADAVNNVVRYITRQDSMRTGKKS